LRGRDMAGVLSQGCDTPLKWAFVTREYGLESRVRMFKSRRGRHLELQVTDPLCQVVRTGCLQRSIELAGDRSEQQVEVDHRNQAGCDDEHEHQNVRASAAGRTRSGRRRPRRREVRNIVASRRLRRVGKAPDSLGHVHGSATPCPSRSMRVTESTRDGEKPS